MKVYEFIYNDSTYDGASITMSIHKTREGAEKAMEEHKVRLKKEDDELYSNFNSSECLEDRDYEWDYGKYWSIRETELLL